MLTFQFSPIGLLFVPMYFMYIYYVYALLSGLSIMFCSVHNFNFLKIKVREATLLIEIETSTMGHHCGNF